MECTKMNCPMQVGTVTENCVDSCPWRTTVKPDDLISRAAAKFQACNWSVKPNAVIYEAIKEAIKRQLDMAPAVDAAPVVRCRDCKYYEVKDMWADFGKVPIFVSDVPTCHKWGDGECKTSPDGYCFLGERR